MQTLSNKQSAKVICRFDKFRTHSKGQKTICEYWKPVGSPRILLHNAQGYNPGLTSCEDLDMALVISNDF